MAPKIAHGWQGPVLRPQVPGRSLAFRSDSRPASEHACDIEEVSVAHLVLLAEEVRGGDLVVESTGTLSEPVDLAPETVERVVHYPGLGVRLPTERSPGCRVHAVVAGSRDLLRDLVGMPQSLGQALCKGRKRCSLLCTPATGKPGTGWFHVLEAFDWPRAANDLV